MKTFGLSVAAVAACLLSVAPAEARAHCRGGQMYRPSTGECMSRGSFFATMRGSRYSYRHVSRHERRMSRREMRRMRREEAREEAREAALEEMRRSRSRLLPTRPIVQPVVVAVTEADEQRAEAEMFAAELPPAPASTSSIVKPATTTLPAIPFKMTGPGSLNPFSWQRTTMWNAKPFEVQ